jgi:copper(I)-binding protein
MLGIAFALAVMASTGALAHSYRIGEVAIGHPWTRPTAGSETEVYLTLLNRGAVADRLERVSADIAAAAAIVDAGGRRLGGIELLPNRPVALKTGRVHIRLSGLKQPLDRAVPFKLTLYFAWAGVVVVDVTVEADESH